MADRDPSKCDAVPCLTNERNLTRTNSMVRVLVKVLTAQVIKKLFIIYGTRKFMPCSQKLTTGPCPDQMNSVQILPSYLFTIYFKIVFPSTPRSCKLSLSFMIFFWNVECNVCYMPHAYHPSLFEHPNNIWRGVKIKTLCNFLKTHFVSFLLGTNIPKQLNYCEVICRQCNWIKQCSDFILCSWFLYWIITWVMSAEGITQL